ncbi:hypothetical protein PHJA_002822900 [Phtheirospermum japonicum]|uniref:C2 NT-type domain-containing protein n=1 Tax=Phtheirospermum japonicum TaxID=374723 RepID=A0A830DAJ9_9LAMI|nr:hypothetical protein PHJA_002822900 [Phtheirospermum japonicum]
MATDYTNTRSKSNTQILQELEALSDTLYQSHTSNPARRTASLALPRTAIPSFSSIDETNVEKDESTLNPKPRTRRMSLSPWRSRPKLDSNENGPNAQSANNNKKFADNEPLQATSSSQKKGIWNWKPIRALAHIGMQKLSCLFSVEVVTVQNLPASMNGLRLSVCVRKTENKDGAVQTMPSRVSHGAADFEETLFIRCHVYYTLGSGTHMKFEPRPFLLYVSAVDAEELDFGKSLVDLSALIQESIERSFEGTRIRQWDKSFNLIGKAKGGELVLKLGFQIMEKDGGVGIYSQAEGRKGRNSPSFARKQSKTSFSVPSPRMTSRAEAWTPSQKETTSNDLQEIDDLNLDEPGPPPQPAAAKDEKKPDDQDTKMDDQDLPDFDVVDKGVEIQDKDDGEVDEEQSEENSDKRSVSSEVVKEVVQDQTPHHLTRLTELDSIAQQIKALESMMGSGAKAIKADEEETGSQTLDAEEDKVTREFFQMLEDDDDENDQIAPPTKKLENYENSAENDVVFLPDLGKGLGCVVQTKNGGYLAATNPLDTKVERKETPKLAMQMSKPLIIQSNTTGFEMFQKIAATGLDELTSQMVSLMPIDELIGKTAEQIAFEGIASAIIQGRNNKEGASSSAARTIAAVKNMSSAMINGRKERVSTGIWNVSEEPLTVDEILAFSLQKIENMAVEALKIQADVADEEAPFDVSPIDANNRLLASAVPVEDWFKTDGSDTITISLAVQLRDPVRQYEAVGGPMIALIHATSVNDKSSDAEEKKYKVASLQVGGVNVRSVGTRSVWDTEKQKLTALQWLVAYGMGKAGGKKGKRGAVKGPDVLWSISSRVMADMWLKPIRNPDVKFINK